ncbi:MAG: hypothetical protein EDS66_12715 [Planctomycetota bacterium]|nr:MAG: hypothetical protein EDS66_12715 [Planctomycetota bacterium]
MHRLAGGRLDTAGPDPLGYAPGAVHEPETDRIRGGEATKKTLRGLNRTMKRAFKADGPA